MINDPALTSDKMLLQIYAKNQDPEALAEIIKRYAGLVYGTCRRVLENYDDAQDVSQDCFLELARKAGSVRSSLPAYLHHLARNRSIDAIRKSATRRHHEREAILNSSSPDPTWSDIAPLIDDALASLPERLRIPIILHYLQGYTQAQVANELGASQPTTSRNLDKGIAMLRDQLKNSGVLVTTAALTVLLAQNASTAAPAALIASLGKLAVSGITAAARPALATGLAAMVAPLLGTLTGKLALGILGLAAVWVTASSATSALRARDAAYVPPFTGVTRITGPAAADLGEKARMGALAAAQAITSGRGIVQAQTSSKMYSGQPYDCYRTYDIAFSGRKYACNLQQITRYSPDPKRKRQTSPDSDQTYRIWNDGVHVTSYEIGTNHAKTGTLTDVMNSTGPVPWEHDYVRADVSVWGRQDAIICWPSSYTADGITMTAKQTAVGKQTLNGDECIVLETTTTSTPGKGGKDVMVHWVNTKKGYALTKERIYVQRTAKSEMFIVEDTDIVLRDYGHGLWGPSRITKVTLRYGDKNEPLCRERHVITYDPAFQVNIPIDDKEFTANVPAGVKLIQMK